MPPGHSMPAGRRCGARTDATGRVGCRGDADSGRAAGYGRASASPGIATRSYVVPGFVPGFLVTQVRGAPGVSS